MMRYKLPALERLYLADRQLPRLGRVVAAGSTVGIMLLCVGLCVAHDKPFLSFLLAAAIMSPAVAAAVLPVSEVTPRLRRATFDEDDI